MIGIPMGIVIFLALALVMWIDDFSKRGTR